MRFVVAAALALLATVVPQASHVAAAPAGAAISSLPGFGKLPFQAYGGYFPVNDGQKQLYYFFAESLNNPKTAPVLLWLNGGPGCSSFDGFVYEHGPFIFSGPEGAQQTLTLNPNAWNTVANVIYLDSPAGVGLSYSTDPNNDYNTNDDITAKDSHQFLLNFFAAYPEFANNEFYIAGESYAGIYVPTLANQIMLGNQQNNTINLKGILVGNGVSDQVYDGNAFIPFVIGHGWVDSDTANTLTSTCGGNYWNATNSDCVAAMQQASQDVGQLNVYNPYGDCSGASKFQQGPLYDLNFRMQQRSRDYAAMLMSNVPCVDASAATAWLNLDTVRTAIHAIPTSQQSWTICADDINYQSTTASTLPIHKALLAAGIRVLVYSGDTDMCVPFTGSEAWTRSLGFQITDAWRPWLLGPQVAGYTQSYAGGLSFITIKGAGHMVPQFKPQQALQFLTRFLNNQPF